jgi:hypothetical protein
MQMKVVTLDVRLSENTKRAIRWVLLPVAVLLGTMAAARALPYDTSWIMNGKPVSSMSMTTLVQAIQSDIQSLLNGSKGVVVTVWQNYIPVMTALGGPNAGSAIPNEVCTGRYRRVGDTLDVSIYCPFTAPPNSGATMYQWSLPSGLSVDYTKTAAPGTGEVLGMGAAGLNEANMVLSVFARSPTTVACAITGNPYFVNDTSPYAFTSKSEVQLRFTVPIVGWTVTQ